MNDLAPDADDREAVTVEVEISEALVDLIRREHGDDVDLEEWIAGAAEMRLREKLWHEDATVTVDIPDELAERAELLAEHSRVQHGASGHQATADEWLAEFVDVEYDFEGDRGAEGGRGE